MNRVSDEKLRQYVIGLGIARLGEVGFTLFPEDVLDVEQLIANEIRRRAETCGTCNFCDIEEDDGLHYRCNGGATYYSHDHESRPPSGYCHRWQAKEAEL